ncbi:FG-GAP repeat domain-containing protein [Candidatus Midichloria mitochondrii]|uniref:FG-GAP repeat domain-containing protein n=1 Tax=Candidatus Midichloria mitochondrii TaxID=234827 RepID=UPI00059CC8DC
MVASSTQGTVSVLLGNGGGCFFKAAVNYNVGHNSNGIAVGDFNEDRYPDITVPNGVCRYYYLCFNKSRRWDLFLPATTFGVSSYPSRLLNEDFNMIVIWI